MTLLAQQLPLVDWGWIARNTGEISEQAIEHLSLTGVAVGGGLVLAALLSAAAIRWPSSYQSISSISGLLYTIPSLAVFAFVAPIFGIGTAHGRFLTAEVALISYTLLILVRNIVTGISGVSPDVVEAAAGMGYSSSQIMRKVQIPLAMPVIVAGLRIATVTVVGLVTVTSLLGLGGLGFFILNGLRKSIVFPTEIVVGVGLSVLLAAVLDVALLFVGRLVTPWSRNGSTA